MDRDPDAPISMAKDITPLSDEPMVVVANTEVALAETIGKAYELYLTTDATPSDIAIQLGVPPAKIHFWITKFRWKSKKLELEQQIFRDAETASRAYMIKERLPTIMRHVAAASTAENLITKLLKELDDAVTAGQKPEYLYANLKRLTEALSSATSVSARALGISDTPFKDAKDDNVQNPMILLNVVPVAVAEQRTNPVIDITEEHNNEDTTAGQ